MNIKSKGHRQGWALICVGMGLYLLALEAVRLINSYATEFYLLVSEFYVLSCLSCAALIAVGLALFTLHRAGILAASILGIVSFCFLCVALFYCAYVIPFSQQDRFLDWLRLSIMCLAGILLVVWGGFNLVRQVRKG